LGNIVGGVAMVAAAVHAESGSEKGTYYDKQGINIVFGNGGNRVFCGGL
jgi:hypothetical protein